MQELPDPRLTGSQVKAFHHALKSAFPASERLAQMVRMELDQRLGEIAGTTGIDLDAIIFQLIEWAEANGKVRALLAAAARANSGNTELQAFARQMIPSSASSTAPHTQTTNALLQESTPIVREHLNTDVLPGDEDTQGKLIPTTETHRSSRVNPFTYGNPISDPQRFFGRSGEITQVFSRLRNPEAESSSLVGERRIGKTSLLNYIAHPSVRQAFGLDPDKYIFVYIDLQILDLQTTPLRLWQRFLSFIARNCPDKAIRSQIEEAAKIRELDNFLLDDLFESLDRRGLYIVLLLDEFENVTRNPNFGSDFFYGLRSLAIHHHLSLITASRQALIDLCHSDAIRSSPFFNIFANIDITLLAERNARQLLAQSLAGTGITFSDLEVAEIFRLAGYHPYFLQAAGHFLFEAYTKDYPPDERIALLRTQFREEARSHLGQYWQSSDDPEKIVLLILALLTRQATDPWPLYQRGQLQRLYRRADQVLDRLSLRGLVIIQAATCRLFSTALPPWIVEEVTSVPRVSVPYAQRVTLHQQQVQQLPIPLQDQMLTVLDPFSIPYRELILTWLGESATVSAAITLLQTLQDRP